MIVIAGKNNIAVHAVENLIKKIGADSVGVIPNKTDNGIDGWQRSLKAFAFNNGIKIFDLNSIQEEKSVKLFLSLEFDQLVDPARMPTNQIYNIHFSALPKYKGMYTSVWPILNGDGTSGVTLHRIDRGIDTGSICAQKIFDLGVDDRCSDLYRKYIENSIQLFDENIDALINGQLTETAQNHHGSTYYSRKSINFQEIKIDFNVTAWQLQRQIYAYTFRVYQLPSVLGKSVVEVKITNQPSILKPGTIFNVTEKFVEVACVDYDAIIYFDNLSGVLESIKSGSLYEAKSSLRGLAGVHDRNENGWSPIIVAAYFGRKDIVEYLLACGANINDRNYKGTTVLMYAKNYCLKSGNKEFFDSLLDQGANIELTDYSGKSLLDYLKPQEKKILGL